MPETTHSLGPLWAEIKAELRRSREARAARKALARELAAYTSERDLNDLDAVLARHDYDDTAEIRRILAQRQVQAQLASAGAGLGGGRD
jgi:hypothetical protein